MTKKLIWRLREQPSSESLRQLVKDGLLTKDEAREILFNSEEQKDRDVESLKSEIKFLRELVEKLSNRSQIITTIREIEVPYKPLPWYQPYVMWTGTSDNSTLSGTSQNFSNIETF